MLAVNQIAINDDLECTTPRGNERQIFDGLRVVVEQFFRQTDGAWGVVSSRAVFDTDLEFVHELPPDM